MNSPRVIVPLALLVAAVTAVPAQAKSAKVKKATLSWSQTNVYVPGAQLPVQKTYLGYVASFSKGTVTPLSGAKGPTVTGTSAAGPTSVYTNTFTAKKGKFDAKAKKGTLAFKGILEFKSPAFDYSVENPSIVLNGKTGKILASGRGQTGTYAKTEILSLDLSKAKVKGKGKTFTISQIVPAVASATAAFPYPVGSGPERTPNTVGSFALKIQSK